MKILLVHNHYKQFGGEDVVFAAEQALLTAHGHEVIVYEDSNDRTDQMGKLQLALNTIWSRESYAKLTALIKHEKPDIAHFHNTFMTISPSAYYPCKEAGIPIVQTLHNYRLLCLAATFYRDGAVCEDCLGKKIAYPGVLHGCYHGSKAISAVVAAMVSYHDLLGTWSKVIDQYLVLTPFAKAKFIQAGFAAEKITVKPNFLTLDPLVGEHQGNSVLFVGRLTQEKGILTLLEAWKLLGEAAPLLKVVGEGPLSEQARAFIQTHGLTQVELLGLRSRNEIFELLKHARVLIQPSEWYEGFPMTIVESFACGTPVITSRLGSMAAIEQVGAGVCFEAGNAASLVQAVQQFATRDLDAMQGAARQEYEAHYTAEQNYQSLIAIYSQLVTSSSATKTTMYTDG